MSAPAFPPEPLITKRQLGKLWGLLKESGRDREKAHAFLAFETARPDLTSSKQLTRQEASMVIQVLEHELSCAEVRKNRHHNRKGEARHVGSQCH